MPDYINPNSFTVHLQGPDGIVVRVNPYAKITLSSYFDKYQAGGFIKLAQRQNTQQLQINNKTRHNINIRKTHQRSTVEHKIAQEQQRQFIQSNEKKKKKQQQDIAKAKKIVRNATPIIKNNKTIVGKRLSIDATELLKSNLEKNIFPISNNIGVGILSYERPDSLKRLINSIIKYTNLHKTTIFISDDASNNIELSNYLKELSNTNNFVILNNKNRLGVAGNSNRLLRCLSRFKYGIILNDDVEILDAGWEYFYPHAMQLTNMHHFLYRQIGVYNAKDGNIIPKNDINLKRVDDKPHGAVMAFTNDVISTCGYFNESYGIYGMEHVDWSQKVWEMRLQEDGFWDVDGSDKYFKIHDDKSSVIDRGEHLKNARNIFNDRSSIKIKPSEASSVPEITYVIPFRDLNRNKSIVTVINNIRAHRFPVINIIMVEQDSKTRINLENYEPVSYYLAQQTQQPLFNKSIAFNTGVKNTLTSKVILHDADMITQSDYTSAIWNVLESSESCHLGGKVIYANKESTEKINNINSIYDDIQCERVVGYFEGGSLACIVSAYWRCGAFNEDFWGYGCEDCDFYTRLSKYTKWVENRTFDFVHLWHPRVGGWNEHHNINKDIESKLKVLSIDDRVRKQYEQLRKNGYQDQLDKAII